MMDHINIVLNRLASHFFFYMLKRSKFITVGLPGLILECIGIHRIETKTVLGRKGSNICRIGWYIPGDMQ